MPPFLKLLFVLLGSICVLISIIVLLYHVFDFFHIVEPYYWLWLVGFLMLITVKYTESDEK